MSGLGSRVVREPEEPAHKLGGRTGAGVVCPEVAPNTLIFIGRKKALELLDALDVADPGNFAQAGNDAIQVSEIGDVDDQVDVAVAIGSPGFDVADVGVVVAHDSGDVLEDSGAVVAENG